MEATWADVRICLKLWGKFAIMKNMLLFSKNLCKLFPRVPDLLKPSSTSYNLQLTNILQTQNKYSIAEEKALTTGGVVTFNSFCSVVETGNNHHLNLAH